jgi:hypothetical protein
VFTINENGSVSTAWQTNNSAWSSWQSLYGGAVRQLAITNNQDGRLEVFALDGHNSVQHKWETNVNIPTGWSNWSMLGGFDIQQVTAGLRSDGKIQLEVLGGDSAVYQMTQSTQNGSWPGSWRYLGGSMQQLVQANSIDNSLHLYGLSRDDVAYAYAGTLTSAAARLGSLPGVVNSSLSLARNRIKNLTVPLRLTAAPTSTAATAAATTTTVPPTLIDLTLADSESMVRDLVRHTRRRHGVGLEAFAGLDSMTLPNEGS